MVELEEIQCPICKEQFCEKLRLPMLLPDCGHSYCLQCIQENSLEVNFAERRRQTITSNDDGEDGSQDDLLTDSLPDLSEKVQHKFSFSCPEDG